MASVLRARDSFVAAAPRAGEPEFLVRVGDVFPADHPVIRGREAFFEPAEAAADRATRSIERATAEPGDRRSLTRPRRSAAEDPQQV